MKWCFPFVIFWILVFDTVNYQFTNFIMIIIRSTMKGCPSIFSSRIFQYVTYCWAIDDEFGNVEYDHAEDEDEIQIDDSEPLTFSSDSLQNNFKLPTGSQTLTKPGKNDFEDVTKEHTPAPSRNFQHHKSSVKNTLSDFKISGR